jgi:hypothetical protein
MPVLAFFLFVDKDTVAGGALQTNTWPSPVVRILLNQTSLLLQSLRIQRSRCTFGIFHPSCIPSFDVLSFYSSLWLHLSTLFCKKKIISQSPKCKGNNHDNHRRHVPDAGLTVSIPITDHIAKSMIDNNRPYICRTSCFFSISFGSS